MSPTTTASFADLTLTPSCRLMGALVLLYASALVLLLLCVFRQSLPLPAFFAVAWWLLCEGERRLLDIGALTGRLQISSEGNIRWQGQSWRLQSSRVRSGFILLWRLEGETERVWLPISPDACSSSAYRSLALYSHHYRAISG
ncbi:protein YgfX [Photobacterium gaetbulicola]|nr:protein YgfX [Photobacterium gaetbulicola]